MKQYLTKFMFQNKTESKKCKQKRFYVFFKAALQVSDLLPFSKDIELSEFYRGKTGGKTKKTKTPQLFNTGIKNSGWHVNNIKMIVNLAHTGPHSPPLLISEKSKREGPYSDR